MIYDNNICKVFVKLIYLLVTKVYICIVDGDNFYIG